MKELKIKAGRPLLNYVVLTADKYTVKDLTEMYGGIVPAGMVDQLKPYQKIVSISPKLVSPPFQVGDLVLINIKRYGNPMQKKDSIASGVDDMYNATTVYNVPVIELDGVEHLKLGDNDIEFIIDEYEFVEPNKVHIIETVPTNILVPGKHNIIN